MNVIPDFLENSVKNYPQKQALIINEKTYTYKELYNLVSSFSSSISHYPKKSVITMIFENSLEFLVSYLGILNSDCIAHLVSPSISEHNFVDQINSAQPKIIVTSKEIIQKINKMENKIEKFEFSEMLTKHGDHTTDRKPICDDLAYLIYTSGTTSNPKGVGISHSNALFTTKNIVNILKYSNSDVDVVPLPLSHSFGLGCLHAMLFVGSTLILHKNTVDLDKILDSIQSHNATTFAAVPTTLTKLLKEHSSKLITSSSTLRLIVTNSTSISKETVTQYFHLLKKGKLATYYGLTEASRSTFMIFDKLNGKEESVGLPAPEVQIKLIDANNERSSEGIICIKGKNVIKEYWNNVDANKNIVDGWLKTGDVGYTDSDGFLYLKGRIDYVINIGGEKVMPEEIESVVKVLPGVDDAMAIGIKHDFLGQAVKLFVQKSNNSTIEKSDIISHCLRNLERYKVPIQIEFVKEFPRNEYGKIKRFNLGIG